jgi:hypothetical protein
MSVGDHRLGVSMVSVAHLVVSVVLLVGALRLQSRFFHCRRADPAGA